MMFQPTEMDLDLGALLSPSIMAATETGNNANNFLFPGAVNGTNAAAEEIPFLPFEDVIATPSNSTNNGNSSNTNITSNANVPLNLDDFNNELEKAAGMLKMEMLQDQEEAYSNFLSSSLMEDASTDINEAFMNNLSVIQDPKMLNSPDPCDQDESLAEQGDDETSTESLIEEMEAFLQQHEDNNAVELYKEEEEVAMPKNNSNALTDEESKQAEAILDALIRGNITTDNIAPAEETPATKNTTTNDSGFFEEIPTNTQAPVASVVPSQPTFSGISNISEIITEDGQKIVIVIANDMPDAAPVVAAPVIKAAPVVVPQQPTVVNYVPSDQDVPVATYVSAEEMDSSDSEWVPSPAPVKTLTKRKTTSASPKIAAPIAKGRVQKRGPYKRSTHSNIKDKKERKKLQNVEAARRYRDKKKLEQNGVETEEEKLAEKNNQLKSKLSEMENEVKTLKKLMTELGLVKTSQVF